MFSLCNSVESLCLCGEITQRKSTTETPRSHREPQSLFFRQPPPGCDPISIALPVVSADSDHRLLSFKPFGLARFPFKHADHLWRQLFKRFGVALPNVLDEKMQLMLRCPGVRVVGWFPHSTGVSVRSLRSQELRERFLLTAAEKQKRPPLEMNGRRFLFN